MDEGTDQGATVEADATLPVPGARTRRVQNTVVTVAAIFVVVGGLKIASNIVVPLIAAAFVAMLAWAPIDYLRKSPLPNWAAIPTLFIGIIGVATLLSLYLVTAIGQFVENIDGYSALMNQRIAPLLEQASRLGVDVSGAGLQDQVTAGPAMKALGNVLSSIANLVSDGFFVLIVMLFMIGEAGGIPAKLQVMSQDPDVDLNRYGKILTDVREYIGIKSAISLITATIAGLSVWALGIDYPLLWALLMFLLNFIPTIGSILAAVPPVLLAFMQFGWERALVCLGVYVGLNVIMDSVVSPRWMGRSLGLSPLFVFLSLVFWGWLFGPVGMFLSVPLTMVVKIVLENSKESQWIAVIMGSGAEAKKSLVNLRAASGHSSAQVLQNAVRDRVVDDRG